MMADWLTITTSANLRFVIGRRNGVFSDTVKVTRASAKLYGLIETAKAKELEPYRYLRHVFNELPKAKSLKTIAMAYRKKMINKG